MKRRLECVRGDLKCRIHWAPLSSSLSPYGWIVISPLNIINSASSLESLLDLAGSDAMALLMPRPLLLSTSICLMDHRGLDHGPWLLWTIHTLCHTHWMCYNSVLIPSLHMPSFASVHPGEESSSVALLKVSSLFSLWKSFFYFFGSFSWSDVRSKVTDVVCVQIVKPSEVNL